MTYDFRYEALPMRVRFGAGSVASLPEELDEIGLRRVLVLCSPGQEDTGELVASALGERSVGMRASAVMHVPAEVAERAQAEAVALGADGCVTVGGGSAIGLGKAIALKHGLPIVAVPTTYAGSEMTPVWGLTTDGRKETGRDPKVLPRSVVYDPELTTSLPVGMSVTSGINAMAHAVEALYAPDATPIISLMAEEGVRALATALPVIVANGSDADGRHRALYGAWLCGATLGATTMSLHHKLCHALGGTLSLSALRHPQRRPPLRPGVQRALRPRRGRGAVPRTRCPVEPRRPALAPLAGTGRPGLLSRVGHAGIRRRTHRRGSHQPFLR